MDSRFFRTILSGVVIFVSFVMNASHLTTPVQLKDSIVAVDESLVAYHNLVSIMVGINLSPDNERIVPTNLFGTNPIPTGALTGFVQSSSSSLQASGTIGASKSPIAQDLFSPVSNSSAGAGSLSSSSDSSGSGNSTGKKRNFNRSKQNDACLKLIQEICAGPFSSPDLKKARHFHQEMHDGTERKSKRTAAGILAVAITEDVIRGSASVEEENDRLGSILCSTTSARGTILKAVHPDISSPEQRKTFFLDTNHVQVPRIERDATGKVTKVHGGHNLSMYNPADVVTSRTMDVFVDLKGVVGFFVGDNIPKTALSNFTGKQTIVNLREGTTVATRKHRTSALINQKI